MKRQSIIGLSLLFLGACLVTACATRKFKPVYGKDQRFRPLDELDEPYAVRQPYADAPEVDVFFAKINKILTPDGERK